MQTNPYSLDYAVCWHSMVFALVVSLRSLLKFFQLCRLNTLLLHCSETQVYCHHLCVALRSIAWQRCSKWQKIMPLTALTILKHQHFSEMPFSSGAAANHRAAHTSSSGDVFGRWHRWFSDVATRPENDPRLCLVCRSL